MSNANPPIPPRSANRCSGTTRRSVLSMIPAALLAGWQGLAMRSKAEPIPAAAPVPKMRITPDGYSYVAAEFVVDEPVQPAIGDCYTVWTTVYKYDEHGNVVE